MSLHNKLFADLKQAYNDVKMNETRDGNYEYTYLFNFPPHLKQLTIIYSPLHSTIKLTITYFDELMDMVSDQSKAQNILNYLAVYYTDIEVTFKNGVMVLETFLSINNQAFNPSQFEEKLSAIELMSHEIDEMIVK